MIKSMTLWIWESMHVMRQFTFVLTKMKCLEELKFSSKF